MMVGLRVNRCELDELWSYVGKKQRNITKRGLAVTGDQYTFVAVAKQHPPRIRNRMAHGTITKTYSVTHLGTNAAQHRYSPAEVIAVERDPVRSVPAQISTSYVKRSNLTLRMSSKRFSRFSNGFSNKLEPHCAAVSLYVAHYNLCRVHEPAQHASNGARYCRSRLDR
jgi:IS1 transposase